MKFNKAKRKLEKHGYVLTRVKGSHYIFQKPGRKLIILPKNSKDISPGILCKIKRACEPKE